MLTARVIMVCQASRTERMLSSRVMWWSFMRDGLPGRLCPRNLRGQ
jgi:hypothetical protein